MIARFICMMVFIFPFAAQAQQDQLLPLPSKASNTSAEQLPEGTPKGQALAPPGMNGEEPNNDESCAKPPNLIGQPKSVLETMKFGNTVRILGPDSAATMDFSPSRTNIFYDIQGVITEIRCG